MKKIIQLLPMLSFLSSCGYDELTDYKEYDALSRITETERQLHISTPIALELDGYCMIKKENTWMLLNGSGTRNIRTMNEKIPKCINQEEIDWLELVCPHAEPEDLKK